MEHGTIIETNATAYLTESTASSDFISRYGCEEYFKYNKDLMFYERQYDINEQINELDLES